MDKDQFRRMADTFGADIGRWPDRWRGEAARLAREPWAVAILSEAAALDRLLAAPRAQIAADRADRAIAAVNARLAAEPRPAPRFAWLKYLVLPLPGLVAAGLLGAYLGLSGLALPVGTEADLADLLAAAFSYSDPSFFVMGG